MGLKAREVFNYEQVGGRRALLALCGGLMLVLWLMQVSPYLNVADDAGRYMILGESLARTGELRLINEVARPLDTLYPPGFPAIIAFWLAVTGRTPGGVVVLVKATQLLLALCTLPMLAGLLARARLSPPYAASALIAYALCPAVIGYANEVMSEIPLLFFCLASVVLVEDTARGEKPDGDAGTEFPPAVPVWRRLLALLCAVGAFLVRTSGIALLLAQVAWFWRRFGWRWGVLAALTLLVSVGGWQGRNRQIAKAHPEVRYSSYIEQFTIRDPERLNSGRIRLNARGLLSRMRSGFPVYIGMIPRAVLHMMGLPGTVWPVVFYLVAIPLTLLMFIGLADTWRRGLRLSGGFAAVFWFVAAMWPWKSARFLVPLVPFMLLFAFVGLEQAAAWGERWIGRQRVRILQAMGAALMLLYYGEVHYRVIGQERKPVLRGYALGRNRPEAGFYAACDWLRAHVPVDQLVMGKPPYLLHLYSGCNTTQVEPNSDAGNIERGYMVRKHVRYLVMDAWTFGFQTKRLLAAYLRLYGDRWTVVWEDPLGSGVRILQRRDDAETAPGTRP